MNQALPVIKAATPHSLYNICCLVGSTKRYIASLSHHTVLQSAVLTAILKFLVDQSTYTSNSDNSETEKQRCIERVDDW
jgi:hypothetical protein